MNNIYNLKVEVAFKARVANTLKNKKIYLVGDLQFINLQDLKNVRDFGKKSFLEVFEFCKENNIKTIDFIPDYGDKYNDDGTLKKEVEE